MFGIGRLFSSPPPPDPAARGWIHRRLRWLGEEFGSDRLIENPLIEPTPAFFPDPYDASPRAAGRMFRRVCEYMDVPPGIVKLHFYGENAPELVNDAGYLLPGSAGTYQEAEDCFVIRLNRDELAQPMDLVGTMAHELSHLRLMGENRADPDAFDNELLTDLTAVYFGFGIFLVNSPRAWPSQLGLWPGTRMHRPEYMSLPMIAYALAAIAQLRFEEKPAWSNHLHRSAKAEFRAAMRFMARNPEWARQADT
jgi:hypothetical protein